MAYACRSCGYQALSGPPGSGELCPMCFTADDGPRRSWWPDTLRRTAERPPVIPPHRPTEDEGHDPPAGGHRSERLRATARDVVLAVDDRLTAEHLRVVLRWAPVPVAVLALVALLASGVLRAVTVVLAVAVGLVLVGALAWAWWRLGARRWWLLGGAARRDELAEQYLAALEDSEAVGLELMRVRRVDHANREGTRCRVQLPDGSARDVWFWYVRPRRGWVGLVRVEPQGPGQDTPLHLVHVGSRTTGAGVVRRLPRASWRHGRARMRSTDAPVTA